MRNPEAAMPDPKPFAPISPNLAGPVFFSCAHIPMAPSATQQELAVVSMTGGYPHGP